MKKPIIIALAGVVTALGATSYGLHYQKAHATSPWSESFTGFGSSVEVCGPQSLHAIQWLPSFDHHGSLNSATISLRGTAQNVRVDLYQTKNFDYTTNSFLVPGDFVGSSSTVPSVTNTGFEDVSFPFSATPVDNRIKDGRFAYELVIRCDVGQLDVSTSPHGVGSTVTVNAKGSIIGVDDQSARFTMSGSSK